MMRTICLFYLLLGGAGFAMNRWRPGPLFDPLGSPTGGWLTPLLASFLFIALCHLFFRWAQYQFATIREGARDIRGWMGKLSVIEIALVSLSSGIGEEWFFRGWLLNEIGFIASSILFGLVHIPPNRNWFYWPIFAMAMGFALGEFCLWSQSLFPAILIHAGINFLNFLHILHSEKK